jgi:hypothetical protein
MTQRLGTASGIVAVLFVIGLILVATHTATGIGYLSIVAAVAIGIVYGIMGAGGIARRNGWL